MAIAFVQNGDAGLTLIASGNPATVLPANNTVGNTVILVIQSALAQSVSVVSSMGSFVPLLSALGITVFACYKTSGAAKTITATTSGGAGYACWAGEFSGGIVRPTNTSPPLSTSGTTGSQTANADTTGDLMIAVFSTSGAISADPSSPWTNYNAGYWAESNGEVVSWQVTTSTALQTATITCASGTIDGIILGFSTFSFPPREMVNQSVKRAALR